jgi:hypothetical protein
MLETLNIVLYCSLPQSGPSNASVILITVLLLLPSLLCSLQYKCNTKTGQCTETCPKPNGTPCWGGLCQGGKCIPNTFNCPPNPNKCASYVLNPATGICDLVKIKCQQPPDTCKKVRETQTLTVEVTVTLLENGVLGGICGAAG